MKNRPIKLFLKSLRMDCGLDSIGRDARHSDQRLASWFGFDRVAHVIGMSLVASAFLLAANTASAQYFGLNPAFNQDGNILIADQFNNRVIEANPSGDIVWSFGLGPNDFSSNSIIGVNDAQRVGAFTLMAGTGTPPGVIPQSPNGAADNRVLLVGPYGEIVWQYGQFGQSGDGPDSVEHPGAMHLTFPPRTSSSPIRPTTASLKSTSEGNRLAIPRQRYQRGGPAQRSQFCRVAGKRPYPDRGPGQ
jgi:hypothetical protein